MSIKLKDIMSIDKYIYCMALSLEQPFTTGELLDVIHKEHAGWKIELIKARCKKFRKQKMIKQIGHFHNIKYECLLSTEDLKSATFIYSKPIDIDKLSGFVCGL